MTPLRKFILVPVLAGLLALVGCKKQKPPVPPPQAQAPTITELPPVITPVPEAKPPETAGRPSATPAATPPEPVPPKPKARTRPSRKTEPAAEKPADTAAADRPSPPVPRATPPPPRPDPTLVVPALPHDQAMHDRMTTEILLASTEQNLAGLGRGLSSDQQGMVQQIRVYMQQSRGALQDGDPVRSRNLALKAHLLSDELARH